MIDYKKQGKRNKAQGADFERRVRKDLEEKGWIVSKWQNNVDLNQYKEDVYDELGNLRGKCIPAKPGKFRMMQTGFPDFIAYKRNSNFNNIPMNEEPERFNITFIECKVNGTLSKEEKQKVRWYLENGYCSKFLIAYKTKEKNRVKVNYKEIKNEDLS